ncbi:MAG TPA: ATPase domain-containing protein [Burkholderiaceae bacterium]|nr:ATPase domain-containing protein [Burkholderiaceae bacterium]
MTNDRSGVLPLERVPTHVAGLDDLLEGGLFKGGVYFIQGRPGVGKTTLANQVCFGHLRHGGRALYVTLLAESHARMLQHLRTHSYFDSRAVSREIVYISPFRELEEQGLKGLISLVGREAARHKASLLVLDGLVTATDTAESEQEMRRFVHALQAFGTLHGCTVLLLTSNHERQERAERTMVDGIVHLTDKTFGPRTERRIQIHKFRGTRVVRGEHSFCITDDGIVVYPRLESVAREAADRDGERAFATTGLPGLDRMISGGGVPEASATLVAGPSGVGKTSLALSFLGASRPSEPGLLLGFIESPARLRARARRLGIPLEALEADGSATLHRSPPDDHALDQIGHDLLRAVDRHRARRLVVDGLGGFFETPAYAERGLRFLRGLLDELRGRGVTSLFTVDTGGAIVERADARADEIASTFDTIVALRFVRSPELVARRIMILKADGSDFDPSIRPFTLADGRLTVEPAPGGGSTERTGPTADRSAPPAGR